MTNFAVVTEMNKDKFVTLECTLRGLKGHLDKGCSTDHTNFDHRHPCVRCTYVGDWTVVDGIYIRPNCQFSQKYNPHTRRPVEGCGKVYFYVEFRGCESNFTQRFRLGTAKIKIDVRNGEHKVTSIPEEKELLATKFDGLLFINEHLSDITVESDHDYVVITLELTLPADLFFQNASVHVMSEQLSKLAKEIAELRKEFACTKIASPKQTVPEVVEIKVLHEDESAPHDHDHVDATNELIKEKKEEVIEELVNKIVDAANELDEKKEEEAASDRRRDAFLSFMSELCRIDQEEQKEKARKKKEKLRGLMNFIAEHDIIVVRPEEEKTGKEYEELFDLVDKLERETVIEDVTLDEKEVYVPPESVTSFLSRLDKRITESESKVGLDELVTCLAELKKILENERSECREQIKLDVE